MVYLFKVCLWGIHLDLGKVPLNSRCDKWGRRYCGDEFQRCVRICTLGGRIGDSNEFCSWCSVNRNQYDTKNKSEKLQKEFYLHLRYYNYIWDVCLQSYWLGALEITRMTWHDWLYSWLDGMWSRETSFWLNCFRYRGTFRRFFCFGWLWPFLVPRPFSVLNACVILHINCQSSFCFSRLSHVERLRRKWCVLLFLVVANPSNSEKKEKCLSQVISELDANSFVVNAFQGFFESFS